MMKYLSLALIFAFCGIANAGGHGFYYPNAVVQKVIVPQRVVQFDADYFQGLDHYYSLGEKLKSEKQAENKSEVDYYKGQIELLLKILAAKQGGAELPGPVAPAPAPVPVTPDEPPVQPTIPEQAEGGEYKVTDIDRKAFNIFKNACARCHGDTQQDGGLTLIKGGALQLVDLVDRVEIHDRVNGVGLEARGKAKMPKGGTLSDSDVETLRLWMVQESDRLKNGGK